jgi:hypothetical protein
MSGTLSKPAQTPAAGSDGNPPRRRRRRFGWRQLQASAAAVTLASLVTPMVIEGKVESFLVAMAAPFLIGLVLAGFLPRVAAIMLGVVSAATLAFSAPYIAEALSHPESATDFVPQTFFTLALLIGAAAALPAFREVGGTQGSSRTPRTIAIVAAIGAVAASAVSIAAATASTARPRNSATCRS